MESIKVWIRPEIVELNISITAGGDCTPNPNKRNSDNDDSLVPSATCS